MNFDDLSSEEETILLIGGSSFLGFHTAETLYYFYNIVCTYHQSTSPRFYPEFNWYQVDLSQRVKELKISIKRLIEKTNAKFVINFAGITSPLEASQKKSLSDTVNKKANEIIAQTCGELGAIPIFISTDHVFHGDAGPYSENETPNPLKNSVYGTQKYLAERYYQLQEKFAILRISTTLGKGNNNLNKNIYERVISALEKGTDISGATNKIRSASSYSNVPFAINKIIEGFEEERFSKEIFHLPGELISEYELVKKIAQKNNFSEECVKKSQIEDDNNSYPLTLGLESIETQKKLRGRFLTLEEGIDLLINQV